MNIGLLNPEVVANQSEFAERFGERSPFRHVVIENFFTPDYCAQLLTQFPPFERGNARNEAGVLANKSTIEKIRRLGPAFAALDDLVRSRDFLDLIGRITGIDDLLYDPWYFGGGTHENRNGQDLDVHVDFNRHPVEDWHRRLNLIVYLNHEWEIDWGGALELHSNPRAANDRVTSIAPLFNRAVIFETTESSWHAFPPIRLPQDKQNLTRKSVALYFYTKERPIDELAETHSTIYVDRPLPERFKPGRTLDAADVDELHALLRRRDQHNQRLYNETNALTARLKELQEALYAGRLGRLRYVVRNVLRRFRGGAPAPIGTAQKIDPVTSPVAQQSREVSPAPLVEDTTAASTEPVQSPPATAPAVETDEKTAYQARLDAETAIFNEQTEVHDLPAMFHYWSNAYLRPKLESFGFSNPDEFFAFYLQRAYADAKIRPAHFVSIGAGNCDTEVRVARLLVERGITDFTIECLELNATMLERGRALAQEQGVAAQILPQQADFNLWKPSQNYDAVIANQSLHHVSNLEGLFDAIAQSLKPHGRFITSDMIGRNGHQRWPEAFKIVQEFWQELPESHRYNLQLKRTEPEFLDWDCSQEGFEGIRAQDILPLLIERFDFEFFLGYANVIDPFIDRSFGHHFDANSAADRTFIDRIHARDEAEILAGNIKPTHIMATLRRKSESAAQRIEPTIWRHLTPEFSVRDTASA